MLVKPFLYKYLFILFGHFYASALINANVDVATVSSVLGHSVIGTTTNIYTHAFQEASTRAADVIGSVLDLGNKKEPERDKSEKSETVKIHIIKKSDSFKKKVVPKPSFKIKIKPPRKDAEEC